MSAVTKKGSAIADPSRSDSAARSSPSTSAITRGAGGGATALSRAARRHPAVELSIVMLDPAYSLPQLRAGELDMALSHDAELETSGASGDLEVVHLFDDPMYVAMPAGHPLADAPDLALASFATEPWMLATTHTCPDSRLFLRACHAAGFEPKIAFQHDDYQAMLGFVAAGVGVALIPDMVTRGVRDDVVVRALDRPPPPRPIMVALPAGYRSPAAAAMLDILTEISDAWVAERPALAVA